MKLYWVLHLSIFIAVLCVGLSQTTDDNEFAEFEDEYVESVTDAPQMKQQDGRAPQPRVEVPEPVRIASGSF